MPVSDVRIGAVNLYRRHNHEWGREELETAQILDMASGYILNANRLDDERSRAEGLTQALKSRDVIGQAKGILMSRCRLSAEAAFELLRPVSQDRNVRLRELAAQVVETGALSDQTQPPPRASLLNRSCPRVACQPTRTPAADGRRTRGPPALR
jgi:hypothetical protein